jgi:hypothetical protein
MIQETEKLIREQMGGGADLRFLWFNLSDAALEYYSSLVFEGGNPEPRFVLRVAAGEQALRSMESEYRNLTLLNRFVSSPPRRDTIPRLLKYGKKGNTAFMLLRAVPGRPLKNEPKGPSGRNIRRRLEQVCGWLEGFYAETGIVREPVDEAFCRRYVEKPVGELRRLFPVSREQEETLDAACSFFRGMSGDSIPMPYRHGDLATSNVLVEGGELTGLVDWEIPLRRWLPLFDLFYFCASLRYCYYCGEGDKTQFESFQRAFFEENEFSRMAAEFLSEAARAFSVPRPALLPLFTLSVVTVALWKMGAALSRTGARATSEVDDPFCALKNGECLTLGLLAGNRARFAMK